MGELDRACVFKINLTKERDIIMPRKIEFILRKRTILVVFIVFLLTFAICLFSGKAHAQSMLTGNALLKVCSSQQESSQRECVSYLYGFLRGMAYQRSVTTTLLGSIEPKKPVEYFDSVLKIYCFPEDIKMRQIELIVIKYLSENPNELHVSSSELVLKSIMEAYPCH